MGSRCVLHWMRRQKPYRELPTKTKWWREFEPMLAQGIELRVRGLAVGDPQIPMTVRRAMFLPQIMALVASATKEKTNARDDPRGTVQEGQPH